MGSVEVYDYKQQKWVPYVPDYDKWYEHFKDLRDGYVQPDHMGRYVVGSGARNRQFREEKENNVQRPVVKLVTPVAQATEMAQSEVDRERKKEGGQKRKKALPSPPRRKKVYKFNPEYQL